MLILAIETSTQVGSVALLRDEERLAEISFGAKERHSAELIPAVANVLAQAKIRAAQIDLWAVGLGPGSFLGIRVGIAAAKGFALATGQPLVSVASFDALAAENFSAVAALAERGPRSPTAATTPFAVVTDAGRGELYFARYERSAHAEIRILKPDQLPADLPVIGPAHGQCPKARFVALLAREKFLRQHRGDDTLEPIYLREPKFKKHEGHE